MKAIVSVIIVAAYLLMPPLCFASACDSAIASISMIYESAQNSDDAIATEDDGDGCIGSCCAEHSPSIYVVHNSLLTATIPTVPPCLYFVLVPEEIFIPPRVAS